MPDADGYPTDEELDRIAHWDILQEPMSELVEFIRSVWWSADEGGVVLKGKRLTLHTWGWSGNEAIMEAIEKNSVFVGLCWERSVRGGHHYFVLRDVEKPRQKRG